MRCARGNAGFALFCAMLLFAISAQAESVVTQFPLHELYVNPGCELGDTCQGGDTGSEFHLGVDLHTNSNLTSVVGTPVRAPIDGVVRDARLSNGYGGLVIIESLVDDEYATHVLGHMDPSSLQVSIGQKVVTGDILGFIGSDEVNGVGKPHVHWGIRKGAFSDGDTYVCGKWKFSGYTPCQAVLSDWYDPMVYTLDHCVGCYSNGWNNNGVSQKFLDAYLRMDGVPLGSPAQDSGNPQSIFVHSWVGAPFALSVQNLKNSKPGVPAVEQESAILWKQSESLAHVVRGGFWNQYRFNDDANTYGAPKTDEGCYFDDVQKKWYKAAQIFDKAFMLWDATLGTNLEIRTGSAIPSGIEKIAPCGTVKASGTYTGSAEKTFKVTSQSVTYSQVVLGIVNDGGIAYDAIRLFKNGLDLGDWPGNSTGITDNAVTANQTYEYRVEGRFNNWGTVSVSEAITVTTPPNPNTLALSCSPRDSSIVDCTIYDTLWNALAYRLYRNGTLIATTSGREYADFGLTQLTSYTYQAEAITVSGLSLGWTNAVSVTTPEKADETEPPVQPPPQKVTAPIRLISGMEALNLPALINGATEVRAVFQNVGTQAVSIDRFRLTAEVDMGFQVVTRPYPADQFIPPLVMQPGDTYTYQRDNSEFVWPGVYGNATVTALYKIYTQGGEIEVTDIAPNAISPLTFEILEGNTNPDLVVSAVRMVPEQPASGTAVVVEFDVTNQGDRLAGTGGFRVFLNDGSERNSSLPQLSPGDTTTTSFDLGPHTEGVYSLSYSIDPNNYIHEWNEANNTGSFYYSVAPPPPQLPNLTVESITIAPPLPTASDNITYTVLCANNGMAVANPVLARFEEPTESYIQTLVWMDPGSKTQITPAIGYLAPGTYTVTVTMDPNNQVAELNEADNSLSVTFTVADSDTDGDGVKNSIDNCSNTPNANQANADADAFGDACDNCPAATNPDQADADADGRGNLCDNCVSKANQDQANSDTDTFGNVCDNCPTNTNQSQADTDGDGLGDVCDVPLYTGALKTKTSAITWNNYANTADDGFVLDYTYKLGSNSDQINPKAEATTVTISTVPDGVIYTETIPANDPRWTYGGGIYTFTASTAHGITKITVIPAVKKMTFTASAATVKTVTWESDLNKTVTVAIVIGNDLFPYNSEMKIYADAKKQVVSLK